jgi:hypothetical protein
MTVLPFAPLPEEKIHRRPVPTAPKTTTSAANPAGLQPPADSEGTPELIPPNRSNPPAREMHNTCFETKPKDPLYEVLETVLDRQRIVERAVKPINIDTLVLAGTEVAKTGITYGIKGTVITATKLVMGHKAKSIIKLALKLTPGVSLIPAVPAAIYRFYKGQVLRGTLELVSGGIAFVPICGTAAAIFLDLGLATSDICEVIMNVDDHNIIVEIAANYDERNNLINNS